MKRAIVAGLSLLLFSACPKPGPKPPTPPEPPPEVEPSPVCVPPGLVTGCWHRPPGEPWQFIPAPDTPAPLPGWNPTLNPGMLPPVLPDAQWIWEDVDQNPQMTNAVAAAVRFVRDRFPEKWADTCLVRGVADIDAAYATISARLHAGGIRAGQGTNDANPRADHATVERAGSNAWEEWKLFEYGRGCLTGHPYKGAARPAGSAPPPPPPPTDDCPAQPCPIRTWTSETLPPGWGDNELGQPAWEWKAKVHTMGNADSTPVTKRQEPFCRAIGMSPYADGQPRAACPMRPDGHPDRELVEDWLLEGGPKRDSRNGQNCTPNNTTNAFAFLAGTGNCRICNTPKTVCSAWF